MRHRRLRLALPRLLLLRRRCGRGALCERPRLPHSGPIQRSPRARSCWEGHISLVPLRVRELRHSHARNERRCRWQSGGSERISHVPGGPGGLARQAYAAGEQAHQHAAPRAEARRRRSSERRGGSDHEHAKISALAFRLRRFASFRGVITNRCAPRLQISSGTSREQQQQQRQQQQQQQQKHQQQCQQQRSERAANRSCLDIIGKASTARNAVSWGCESSSRASLYSCDGVSGVFHGAQGGGARGR